MKDLEGCGTSMIGNLKGKRRFPLTVTYHGCPASTRIDSLTRCGRISGKRSRKAHVAFQTQVPSSACFDRNGKRLMPGLCHSGAS